MTKHKCGIKLRRNDILKKYDIRAERYEGLYDIVLKADIYHYMTWMPQRECTRL